MGSILEGLMLCDGSSEAQPLGKEVNELDGRMRIRDQGRVNGVPLLGR